MNEAHAPTIEGRVDLAAALRLAAAFDLHEGIDNHFSFSLLDGTFLVNRWGVHWSQIRPQDILQVDCGGKVVHGTGEVERTAFCIHAAIHQAQPLARAVLHTHMPHATTLCCTDAKLEWISQNSLRFYGRIAYDDDYQGLANDSDEGVRLARQMGSHAVLMMRHHGVIVTGPSIAKAFSDLYFLERAAKVQVLAHASGYRVLSVPPHVIDPTVEQIHLANDHDAHFEALKELLSSND